MGPIGESSRDKFEGPIDESSRAKFEGPIDESSRDKFEGSCGGLRATVARSWREDATAAR